VREWPVGTWLSTLACCEIGSVEKPKIPLDAKAIDSAMSKATKKSRSWFEAAQLVRRLMRENLRNHLPRFAIAVCCMVLIAASTAAVAWLMREMVNGIYVDREQTAIWMVSFGVMLAYLTKGVASYLQTVTLGAIGARIVANMQMRQFDKLLTFGMGYFSGAHPSSFMHRVQQSARASQSLVVLVSTNLFRDLLTLVGLGAVMFFQNPGMSLVALFALPMAIAGIWWISRLTREVASQEDEVTAAVSSAGTEAIEGLRIIKSFTMEPMVSEHVAKSVKRMENRTIAVRRITGLTTPMMETIGGIIIGLFIIYAGWQTLENGQLPGQFMAFITAFLLAYEPAKRLAHFRVQLNRHLITVERMYALLDKGTPEETLVESREPFRIIEGSIDFQNVSFAYRKGHPVLEDVSFSILPGESVALVGRSGAGKSTVVNLILQMFRHKEGRILIDGRDIATVSLPDLRSGIAYVTQDTFLFSGSIRDNIRFGRPQATDLEVEEAARAANASQFIKNFAEEFDTDVGENGNRLSGGQRQRIAIARALIKDAPILLLDEATSSLDGESERAVRSAESRLMAGRTTIVVAHRLSTIRQAKKIILLDAGRVVAIGTHDSLLASNNIYQALFSDTAPMEQSRCN
jgi:ABC-type multidrug transport system fused ATPase/permease subunit